MRGTISTVCPIAVSAEANAAAAVSPAAEKVASFLYYVACHVDPERPHLRGPVEFELPLTRAEIGDFLGLTIETVSRQFTKLRKSGTIEIVHNRSIKLLSLDQIRRHAKLDHESWHF